MICLVAEKPSVARDIAATLGQPTKHEGYLTVGDYAITWAFGHLAALANPEEYDAQWKAWSFTTLPMLPPAFKLAPVAKTTAQLKIIHGLMKQADSIIAATDGDREGELIFRYIYRLSRASKPVQRLWLSENTPAAIQKALASMKPLSAYKNLGDAAEARSQADWLVGLNATRAFTIRHGQPGQGALSVGRVQTPTLALIAGRDAAIAGFQAMPYWQLAVMFSAPPGTYQGLWCHDKVDRFTDKALAETVQKALGGTGTITQLEIKTVTVQAPLLFSLNDLQKDCNRRFGLTAQQTLDVAQSLYEKHLTSYPRTDAKYITQDIADTIPSRLQGLTGTASFGPLIQSVPPTPDMHRLINATKVAESGHHAIIPTGTVPQGLSENESKVYDLIVRRLCAVLMPDGQDERTTMMTAGGSETFRTQGTTVITPGWRSVLKPLTVADDKKDGENQAVPSGLQKGQTVTVQQSDILEKLTKALPALNDASLLAMMEKYGLGTPATRARILEVLETRGFIQRQKKSLVSTEKGQALLTVVPDSAKDPALTGQWEAQLEEIAQGKKGPEEFLAGIRQYTQQIVEEARNQASQAIGEDFGECPVCHQGRILPGKKAFGCNRWREGCQFVIWREIAGKKLSESQVKALLAGKTTAEIKGFTSKAGKPFNAKLQMVDNQVKFVFDAPKKGQTARTRA